MSISPVTDVAPASASAGPVPRVRHLAREAVVLMAFSAVTSASLAGCLMLLTSLGH